MDVDRNTEGAVLVVEDDVVQQAFHEPLGSYAWVVSACMHSHFALEELG